MTDSCPRQPYNQPPPSLPQACCLGGDPALLRYLRLRYRITAGATPDQYQCRSGVGRTADPGGRQVAAAASISLLSMQHAVAEDVRHGIPYLSAIRSPTRGTTGSQRRGNGVVAGRLWTRGGLALGDGVGWFVLSWLCRAQGSATGQSFSLRRAKDRMFLPMSLCPNDLCRNWKPRSFAGTCTEASWHPRGGLRSSWILRSDSDFHIASFFNCCFERKLGSPQAEMNRNQVAVIPW